MSDGCTMFPEGWWSHCCKAHDAAYEAQIGKAQADAALFSCVAGSGPAGPSLAIALIMFAGVKLFGRRYYDKAKPLK